jgi:hypothetical protein
MREYQLDGLRVRLGQPRQVRELAGHMWFPGLARFPNGDLLLTAILTADTHDNLVNAYFVTTSIDGGTTWSRPYDVGGWGGGAIPRIPQDDGSLAGPDFYLFPEPIGQARSFAGHFERFENGGRRFVRDPFGVHVALPFDVEIHGTTARGGNDWPAAFVFYGTFAELDGEILTTTYLRIAGEARYTAIALASPDRGRTWHYLSTVAPSATAPDAIEGPNESCVGKLPDGSLMCVIRVGRLIQDPPAPHAHLARAFSHDYGRTWSPVDRLPISGVAPCLRLLSTGLLMLSTGRPGLDLWFSTEPRGNHWQSIDLLSHHNATLDTPHRIQRGEGGSHPTNPDQTTAYTEFVEVAPGRLLLTYDRVPFGWKPVPLDSAERNRIYVIDIEVEPVPR